MKTAESGVRAGVVVEWAVTAMCAHRSSEQQLVLWQKAGDKARELSKSIVTSRSLTTLCKGIKIHTYLRRVWVNFIIMTCMCAKSLQLCPAVCDPMDWSPPGSSVHGILQARILEWVAISSSRGSSANEWTSFHLQNLFTAVPRLEFNGQEVNLREGWGTSLELCLPREF